MAPEENFDPTDREGLILRYTPLIKFIANRIAIRLPPHIEVDDLISSGTLGLMDAIEKYDPTREALFKTYAEFRVRGAILDELRAMDWVPRSVRQKANQLDSVFSRLEQEFGRAATDEEAAEEMGMEMDEFQEFLSQSGGLAMLSLDEIVDPDSEGEGRSLLETLAGLDDEDPQALHAMKELRRILGETIDSLPERERLVLSLYYHEEMTMKEIGLTLEVTESRISQIHSKAIARIQARLRRFVEGKR
ncbi:MAG: FliA/WhiG family RNA polymerase sigma factor [bacterium]